jgi:hypothetical protein
MPVESLTIELPADILAVLRAEAKRHLRSLPLG